MRLCVPTLTRYDLLERLIRSAEAGSVVPSEYVIVDNGKALDDAKLKAFLGDRLMTVIRPFSNLGVAASWNLFLDLAVSTGEPVIVSNDDIVLYEQSFGRIARQLEADESVDFVEGFGFALFGITPRCVSEVGYFDESFFAYYEDCDYELRMRRARTRRFAFRPDEMAEHHGFGSAGTRYAAGSYAYFLQKWGSESAYCKQGSDEALLYQEPFNGSPPPGWRLRMGHPIDPSENQAMSEEAHVYVAGDLKLLVPRSLYTYFTEQPGGIPEHSLIEWVRGLVRPSKIFVDAGAHIGTYSLSLARSVHEVVAFEPGRAAYYALCGGIALSGHKNVTAHQVALGSVGKPTGRMRPFVVPHAGGGLSTLRTDLPPGQVGAREEVLVRSLDSYRLGGVGLMKIDVEGSELAVLQGAEHTLRASDFPPLLIEVWQQDWFEKDRNELYGWLASRGYRMTPITGYPHMIVADQRIT